MPLASTLLPAPTASFDALFFAPWAVALGLVAELVVLSLFQRRRASPFRLLPAFLLLKIFAWGLGFAATTQLPSGLTRTANQGLSYMVHTPHSTLLAVAGYACAFVASVAVEYAGLRFLYRRAPLRRLLPCLLVVNAAGYTALALASRYFWK